MNMVTDLIGERVKREKHPYSYIIRVVGFTDCGELSCLIQNEETGHLVRVPADSLIVEK